MKFVYSVEPSDALVEYALDRLELDLRGHNLNGPVWFTVTVVEEISKTVVAALICEFKTPFDVHFSAAIDEPEAITRRLLFGIFNALFTKAARVTALVDPENEHAEEVVRRLGFVYEGFMRRGLDGSRDALLFGMLREDCNYLPGVRAARPNGSLTDGQPTQGTGPLRHGERTTASQRRGFGGQRYH